VVARAFDPFFTTKPIGQGTGLGLSMVSGFAKQSDGHVRIDSVPGQGATVELYLPRHAGSAEATELDAGAAARAGTQEKGEVEPKTQAGLPLSGGERACPGPDPEAGVRGNRSGTALVIEDEAAVRELVLDVLAELGLAALAASDGPAALKILQSDARIDLVVTDVGLPGMNGRALADAAREIRPGLKFLLITGYAENAALARGFLAPGMAMVTKPFAVGTLAARIREMLGG